MHQSVENALEVLRQELRKVYSQKSLCNTKEGAKRRSAIWEKARKNDVRLGDYIEISKQEYERTFQARRNPPEPSNES